MGGDFTRQYVMLQGVQGKGFARVEVRNGQGRIAIRASGMMAGNNLRALLISGKGEGCALDLGAACVSSAGNASWERAELALPVLRGYDAVVIVTDWPENRIILSGYLATSVRCDVRRLQEVTEEYLRVPCQDMAAFNSDRTGESLLRLRSKI